MPFTAISESTLRLYEIAKAKSKPDIEEVQRLVAEGANVNWQCSEENFPTLMWLTYHHHVASLLVCLSTQGDIDFSAKGRGGYTLLHQICVELFVRQEAVDVLHAIVHHVELHPRDIVLWEATYNNMDFIHWAAFLGFLSSFYPVVQDMPYFADRTKPIELGVVKEADWAALSEEDQLNFTAQQIVSEDEWREEFF